MVRQADVRPPPPAPELLSILERPVQRMGTLPAPKIKPWWGADTSGKEFAKKHRELSQNEVRAKDEMSRWLRGNQVGGVEALAKKMNKSMTFVKEKLNGFETTRGINKWVPQVNMGVPGVPELTAGSATAGLKPAVKLSSSMNSSIASLVVGSKGGSKGVGAAPPPHNNGSGASVVSTGPPSLNISPPRPDLP